MSGCGPSGTGDVRSGGWSATGQLTAGDTLKTVSMQALFDGAQNYTLEFFTSGLSYDANGNPMFAKANITWTVEGNQIVRQITIADGTSITGTGQGVRVIISDATVDVLGAGIGTRSYIAGVTLSKGTRGSSKQPPTLAYVAPASAGGSINGLVVPAGTTRKIDVPQGVGINSVMITSSNLVVDGAAELPRGGIIVQHIAGSSDVILRQYDPRFYDWVPVTPAMARLFLKNPSLDDQVMSVVYGIDG